MSAAYVERQAVDELAAVARLKESIADAAKDDPDLLLDMAEGETSILDVIDALLVADLHDAALRDGVDRALDVLALRKGRFDARIKTRRALLEQALLLLDRKKLERPAATITMTERKPAPRVTDESLIPARFFKTHPVLDRPALYEAIAAGEAIPGAEMSNGSVSLTVRHK